MQGPKTRPSLLASLNDPASHEAWIEFDTIYRPLVYRVARAKGLQHADADDLSQQVLQVFSSAIKSFDINGDGSFRSWLYTITRNLVVNYMTRGPISGKRGPIGTGDSGTGDSDVQFMLQQHPAPDDQTATLFRLEYRRSRFQQAARKLKSHFSDDTWQAFWKTSVEGYSIGAIAKELGKTSGAIRSGVIAGTPQYMSPEQARGDSIDHRSDLFSLGSLLYFMLTGRSPFRAETTMGVLHRIVNDSPKRILGINANVPE